MSTLEQAFTEDDEGDEILIEINFQLMNKPFSLTLEHLNQALGKQDYKPSHSKASDIVHLALRYVHRVIVSCALPKAELGSVGTFDLTVLVVAATDAGIDRLPINFAGHFVDRVVEIRSKGGSGEIHFGGMVTLIARCVSIPERTFNTLALPPAPLRGRNFLTLSKYELLGSFIMSVPVAHTSMVAQTFFW
ncbi:Cell growth regulator with EF hand domain protein 1 [Bienertia sinuspersici]